MKMKSPKVKILVISFFLIISCSKDDYEFRLSSFSTPVITGFIRRSEFGDYMGAVGVPNVNNGNYDSDYYFGLYPNPASEHCSLFIKSPMTMSLKKLWITPAQFGYQISNYSNNFGMTNLYAGGIPLIQIEFNTDHIEIDLSSLEEGYYRIYLKIDDNLLYDNLVIINSNK